MIDGHYINGPLVFPLDNEDVLKEVRDFAQWVHNPRALLL